MDLTTTCEWIETIIKEKIIITKEAAEMIIKQKFDNLCELVQEYGLNMQVKNKAHLLTRVSCQACKITNIEIYVMLVLFWRTYTF